LAELQNFNRTEIGYPYNVTVTRRENEGFGFVIISAINKAGSTIGTLAILLLLIVILINFLQAALLKVVLLRGVVRCTLVTES
jgi:hypothetical protein